MRNKLLFITLVALTGLGFAQTSANRGSRVAGVFVASAYNYGVSAPSVTVTVGSTSTGAYSITVSSGVVKLADGRAVPVFATSAPITIGAGSIQEKVTPSAVSGCYSVNTTCVITATFTYAHGAGDIIVSGSAGLQEAINDASAQGGGQVVIDQQWVNGGGTTTIRDASVAKTGVGISDMRSTGPVFLGKSSTSYLPVADFGATGGVSLGTAGSTVGSVSFKNATSGSVTIAPPTGALGTVTATLPAIAGGLAAGFSCGSTGTGSQTCAPAAVNGQAHWYSGESTLSSNAATITFPVAFASTTSFFCVANDVTTRANPVQMIPASGTTATITNTTGASDVIQWFCAGQ